MFEENAASSSDGQAPNQKRATLSTPSKLCTPSPQISQQPKRNKLDTCEEHDEALGFDDLEPSDLMSKLQQAFATPSKQLPKPYTPSPARLTADPYGGSRLPGRSGPF